MFKDKTGKQLTTSEAVGKIGNRLYKVVVELEVFILHIVGSVPIHSIRKLFYYLAGIRIGPGSTIHTGARFYDPKHISIGTDSIIGEEVVFDGRNKISIGNHVDIASQVMIYNSEHDIHSEHFEAICEPVTIDDYVFIGPSCNYSSRCDSGERCNCGSWGCGNKGRFPVFNRRGVPAVVIGERKNKNPHYVLGRADLFR